MKLQQFLEHHGLQENPFAEEDAQSDHIFQRFCLSATHHPAWDKIYGNPEHPSTSVVFGEKGAGKTALRLQIVEELQKWNEEHPEEKVFILEYDNFNPYLDTFRDRLHGRNRRPERVISYWRLWDHMDGILSIGVNHLLNTITGTQSSDVKQTFDQEKLSRLSRLERRDLLLLASFYNHSHDQPYKTRWHQLRKQLKFSCWKSSLDWVIATILTIATVVGLFWYGVQDLTYWYWVGLGTMLFIFWLPWILRQTGLWWRCWQISRQIRIFDHSPNLLRKVLSCFTRDEIQGQPMPHKDRSDDRYELLRKFQNILKTLGFKSIVILVDRMDEPHLINGNAERIRDLLWPMFDNKFLKHPGLGFKMLLPAEVVYYLNREKDEFYERSRLDKQNLIMSLEWTGESLFDVANDRIRACASSGNELVSTLSISDWFKEDVSREELIRLFAQLRVPRHLFKFLHRLLVEHCQRYTDDSPDWKINHEELNTSFMLYQREQKSVEASSR
ncbi:hypothetical protein Pla110_21130 [Polystyrenella longa]|uniref:KAP family P-loop domain protein n=1 Tax=Polystyrenella longa TaxID=2528007 RepID=A0A518CMG9_9PLAN|nr:hypothetical protein [Polystyrenella longa]QDU80384.1 hypothetical protein Pla110_21130 [Polystyrenella longa]